jgi:hypothetical protein
MTSRTYRGETAILQPVHRLVEVAAVLARVTPQTAVDDIDSLAAMEFPTTNEPDVLRRAAQLAIEAPHGMNVRALSLGGHLAHPHVFDHATTQR